MTINRHNHRPPDHQAHWRIRKTRLGYWIALDTTPGPGYHALRWNTGQQMLTSLDPRNYRP